MQLANGAGKGFAILTTAVGATFGGSAQAALVSTAPSGFTPVTITATSGSYSFDLDGNGSVDFTIAGDGTQAITVTGSATTSGEDTFGGLFTATTDPSTLTIGNIKSNFNGATISSGGFSGFSAGVAEFSGLATNAAFGSDAHATAGTLGYFEGIYDNTSIPTFQLLDYGLITSTSTAVPEPVSLSLLATGAAGIAVLRRRRAARAA